MAFQPQRPTVIGASTTGTADSSTGTTGVALPGPTMATQPGDRFVMVTNRGSVELHFKMGASTGPDANSDSTGGGRVILPGGSVQVFRRRTNETHFYVYAASSCNYIVNDADGQ